MPTLLDKIRASAEKRLELPAIEQRSADPTEGLIETLRRDGWEMLGEGPWSEPCGHQPTPLLVRRHRDESERFGGGRRNRDSPLVASNLEAEAQCAQDEVAQSFTGAPLVGEPKNTLHSFIRGIRGTCRGLRLNVRD